MFSFLILKLSDTAPANRAGTHLITVEEKKIVIQYFMSFLLNFFHRRWAEWLRELILSSIRGRRSGNNTVLSTTMSSFLNHSLS